MVRYKFLRKYNKWDRKIKLSRNKVKNEFIHVNNLRTHHRPPWHNLGQTTK